MLSYPYWLLFELMAPLVEFTGFIFMLVAAILGYVDWTMFAALLGFIVSFGILYSIFAILMEVLTYNQYKRSADILRLVLTAVLEPFVFHPFVVWSAIRGNIDLLRKKNSWGEMSRQGFTTKKTNAHATA
jgi:multisubunit Na+/H+ antiporter MnhE subunit